MRQYREKLFLLSNYIFLRSIKKYGGDNRRDYL